MTNGSKKKSQGKIKMNENENTHTKTLWRNVKEHLNCEIYQVYIQEDPIS